MSSQWSVLRPSSLPHLSSLLIKHEISASTYTIHVTDLAYIWTESLNRKQIISRAFDENASIDPSEGPNQFRLLLQNIRKSLRGEADTVLNTRLVSGASSLLLEVVASLPPPLSPLIWPIHLTRAPQELLSTELVLPCLRELLDGRLEVASLLDIIKEKDRVIGRLSDRLGAASVKLDTVFPSAVPGNGSRTGLRESDMSSVKGFNEFDVKEWKHSIARPTDNGSNTLLNKVFRDCESFTSSQHGKPDEDQRGGKSSFDVDTISGEHATTQSQTSFRMRQVDEKDLQGNMPLAPDIDGAHKQGLTAFESPSALPAMSTAHDSTSDTTDDDLDSLVLSTSKKTALYSSAAAKGPKKIGVLGEGRALSVTSAPSDAEHTLKDKSHEGEHTSASARSFASAPISSPGMDRPLRKIGKIGGNRNTTKAPEPDLEATQVGARSTKRPGESKPEKSGPRISNLSVSPPPARETSQERADSNRARLKRELEEKKKVPVTKKRKF